MDFLIANKDYKSSINLQKTTTKIKLSEVINDDKYHYLNEMNLFIAHFNKIPNCIFQDYIRCNKAIKWFEEKYNKEIKDFYYYKKIYRFEVNLDKLPNEIYYFMCDDLILHFDRLFAKVTYLFKITDIKKIEEIFLGIEKFKVKRLKTKPNVSLLIQEYDDFKTKNFEISKPKLKIEDNYNDDFLEIHKIIYKKLQKHNEKGLVLLHGKPGTGKTSYVRYLISLLNKEVIFLNTDIASNLINTRFLPFLIENQNSIFVIEDAENIIIKRGNTDNSNVSGLLNITDGLLSDCLNIQIICTFNTNLSTIDSALLRKGRLIAKYEFKELEVIKAQALSKKLGFSENFLTPVTLTEIYNQTEKIINSTNENSIGFKISNNAIT